MRKPVEHEIADAIDGLLGRALRLAARQRLDAGEQFGKGVGLGEIVVAAGAQSLDAVVDLAERGEDQNRRFVALRAQRGDERKAVHLRQHAVDDGHIIAALMGEIVARDAVGGVVDGMAGLAERLDEIARGVAIVFDDEDAHGAHL